MTPSPTGTVTFLFTDIEGYTRGFEAAPEAMARAVARHDACVRGAVEAAGGVIFKTIGDAYQIAFAQPWQALATAVAAQRVLSAEDWASIDGLPSALLVRMAIDVIVAAPLDGDYRTPRLNRIARLMASGHGGQVILTAAVEAAVNGAWPDGTHVRPLGVHRLRDLQMPEAVYQLVMQGLPDVTRPLRTAGVVTTHDRIMVVDEDGATTTPRTVNALLPALRAVVTGQADSIRLSPREVGTLVRHRPESLDAHRLIRIAEWSQPRYRLDERFVDLSLLVDMGGDDASGRWAVNERRFSDVRDALVEVDSPCLVVLGSPGSGKSTLLRRLELDLAIDSVRDVESVGSPADAGGAVTFLIQLNHYHGAAPNDAPPSPRAWLGERWAARCPDLPALDDLLAGGRVVLMLDALNEMPHRDIADYRARVDAWKAFVFEVASEQPGNRIVFSCRSLDYSAPLSSPALRVPQLRIEPMTDERMARFVQLYSPDRGDAIWRQINGSPQHGLLRTPYFLSLLVKQVEVDGALPEGHAALFTGFVRQLLRREVEGGHRLFQPDGLLTARDCRRIAQAAPWRTPTELPTNGPLVARLAGLAYAMQSRTAKGDVSQVHAPYETAIRLIDDLRAEDIVAAGVAMSVLDEDVAGDAVMFFHQLLQEYFAARRMAEGLDTGLIRSKWRAEDVSPTLDETLASLALYDPLPPVEATGWEETTALAAVMAPEPDAFVTAVAAVNLPLAARCAGQTDGQVSADVRVEVAWQLVRRSRDPAADLRARIDAGLRLGELGDPRFERRDGPFGAYLSPPMQALLGGRYVMGRDEPFQHEGRALTEEVPGHPVDLAPYHIGRFAVTNAEWACFMAAGGYDEPRWWATSDAEAWRTGIGAAESIRTQVKYWWRRFTTEPGLLETYHARGSWNTDTYEQWQSRVSMSEDDLDAHLASLYPSKREVMPREWDSPEFNNPSQPVVAICLYEAQAYCCWLAAQSGLSFRLPSEAEWEAAARGARGRGFAFGDDFDRHRANTVEAHIRHTTPVGVFREGDTPEGISDLTGNSDDWTTSLWGEDNETPTFTYPYDPCDGREDPCAGPTVRRVVRGGSFDRPSAVARATCRRSSLPGGRRANVGFRLVRSGESPLP